MVCKIIFRFNIEDTKIHQTWAPPSDKQREGGVLSTLLPQEPFDFSNFRFWHFRFSILTFSIFDFDMSILVARISIWDTFLYHSYAPDTSRYVFLLDFCLKCHYFGNLKNFDFCILFFKFQSLCF